MKRLEKIVWQLFKKLHNGHEFKFVQYLAISAERMVPGRSFNLCLYQCRCGAYKITLASNGRQETVAESEKKKGL